VDAHLVGVAEASAAAKTSPVTVVIDVMRAFTVAAQAFDQGAKKIVLARSLDQARTLRAHHSDWVALKDGPPLPGFDAVNSPGLLRAIDLDGRTLVQKTTAGTAGALAAEDSPMLLCAAFVVAEATASFLRRRRYDSAVFVVTGDDGYAAEDIACAHYIAQKVADADADASGFVRRAARSRAAADLVEGARRGFRGVHPDDVALCLRADRFPFAMAATVENELLVLRPKPSPAG
jgi:2-phosphosulfolactate phosphatase